MQGSKVEQVMPLPVVHSRGFGGATCATKVAIKGIHKLVAIMAVHLALPGFIPFSVAMAGSGVCSPTQHLRPVGLDSCWAWSLSRGWSKSPVKIRLCCPGPIIRDVC